jgi:hypothetical protein
VSVIYNDYKINIIDTPGHSDFGGEVERVLNMADGVILLVDAFEGTMPQTRFVLQKALALGKKPIVVVNKVDKPNCRPDYVHEQVFDLMFTLDANEEQLDFKTIYGSAKQGWMSHTYKEKTNSITPLLDTIIDDIPEPEKVEGTPQMLITSLEYSPYLGRIAVGKHIRPGVQFVYDAVTGEKLEPAMDYFYLRPVDLNGDGCHEFLRKQRGKPLAVLDTDGTLVVVTGGTMIAVVRNDGMAGEQFLCYYEQEGIVRLWGDEDAKDSALLLARHADGFHTFMNKMTGNGYNFESTVDCIG